MFKNTGVRSILWGSFLFAVVKFTSGIIPAAAQNGDSFQAEPAIEVTDNGLFGTFYMYLTNSPIAPVSIETDVPINDPDFYKKVASEAEFVYYDVYGVRQVETTSRIWGYRHNGDVYIRLGSDFHKLSYLGRFSWFVASISTNDRLNSSVREYTYWDSPDSRPESVTPSDREYLVDLQNNLYWDFSLAGLELALQEAPGLLMKFRDLNRRKKKRMRYIYLQRLNETHPFTVKRSPFPKSVQPDT